MKKFQITTYVTLIAAALFSLFSIHFKADVSLLAFPLAAGFTALTVWALYFKLLVKAEPKFAAVSIKLLQYLPYILIFSFILRRAGKTGTYYWYDVVTVLLWCIAMVGRWLLLYWLNPKRITKTNESWVAAKPASKGSGMISAKFVSGKGILFEIVDWIDAIIQAVLMVFLFQIFILQLYVIPSESMVPSFLVKDRVVVFKTASGPKFPLSDVGVPCMKKYKRGDVVVFRNPHYSMDRQSEVRSVVSQIIYMLTFTTVNTNVDENGEPKADPLVKRVCGVGGEQLVMQDGVLYARTAASDEWKPVELDAKFAAWNLNNVSSSIRNGIQVIPLSNQQYEIMLGVEADRRDFDLTAASVQCTSIARQMGSYVKNGTSPDISMNAIRLFTNATGVTQAVTASSEGLQWFRNYMTDWYEDKAAYAKLSDDYYAQASYKLNAMFKLYSGKLYLRTAQLLASGKTQADFAEDQLYQQYYEDFKKVVFYVSIMDQRNMPVFPACAENGSPVYIPKDCYFMMGDNRFNSLDMRHSYSFTETALAASDPYSVVYDSCMYPQYVSRNRMLGTAAYRFWPLGRSGRVKTK